MAMSDTLIKWINDELNRRGWSMRELARRSRLSSGYISAVLAGKKEPGGKFILGVSQGLGVPVKDLENLVNQSMTSTDASFTELSDVIETLTPDERKEVMNYALYHLWKRNKGEVNNKE